MSETINVSYSLQCALSFSKQIKDDPLMYKWMIYALYDSFYSLLTISLKGTTNFEIIDCKDKKCTYDFLSSNEHKLFKLKTLYKIACKLHNHPYESATNDFLEIRNQYAHFLPMSWIIHIDGLKKTLFTITNEILWILENSDVKLKIAFSDEAYKETVESCKLLQEFLANK